MPVAVGLMLEGMPSPRDLHLHRAVGRVVVLAGSTVVAEYAEGDLAMRNMVIVTLRRVGFPGWRVAEVFGLTPTYVARLKTAAARGGAAPLAGHDGPGRPRTLGRDQQELARQWREQGESDLEIGRGWAWRGPQWPAAWPRGAAGAGAGSRQEELELAQPGPALAPEQQPEPGPGDDPEQEPAGGAGLAAEPAGAARGGAGGGPPSPPPGPGGPEITGGAFWSRYAGAMLLHAFTARARAGQVLESAAGRDAGGYRFADVALLSATSLCFALGAATTEQVKHLTASCAGPLAGLAVLPHLRTCGPGWPRSLTRPIRWRCRKWPPREPAADPVTCGVYYVDDHFVPYAGAKPVGKGWNNKRARPNGAARTPTSPRMTGGRCAS